MIRNIVFSSFSIIFLLICCNIIYYSEINSLNENTEVKQVLDGNYISIPSLGVYEPLYSIGDSLNNVDESVTVLEGSSYPTNESSALFLAAHSGPGDIAYFNTINLLKSGDIIDLHYNNRLFQYEVLSIEDQPKDGDIEVKRRSNHQLVLTTCSVYNDDMQTVVVAILI